MIDALPKSALAVSHEASKKRVKPRRVSSHRHLVDPHTVHPKDVLLDGDIQTVRKMLLEQKLSSRPMLPNAQDYQEGLYTELKKFPWQIKSQ